MLPYATQLKNYWNNWSITITDATKEFHDQRDFSDVRLLNINLLCFAWNVHGMHLGWWCLHPTFWFLYACLLIWLSAILFKYSHHIMYMYCDNENSMFWTTTVRRTKLGMDVASYVSVTDLMWSNGRNNDNNCIYVFLHCVASELCWFWTTVNTLL